MISVQGLPNHRRFVHQAPGGSAPRSGPMADPGPSGVNPILVVALVAAVVVAVVVVATYTVFHCSNCGRYSVVKRDPVTTSCPKCQKALP